MGFKYHIGIRWYHRENTIWFGLKTASSMGFNFSWSNLNRFSLRSQIVYWSSLIGAVLLKMISLLIFKTPRNSTAHELGHMAWKTSEAMEVTKIFNARACLTKLGEASPLIPAKTSD